MKLQLSLILSLLTLSMASNAALELGGDFRYRHETSHKEGALERNRQRLRARIKASANVNEMTRVKVQLTSGSGSSTSTNLTMGGESDTGGAFSNSGLELDQAFVELKPYQSDIFKVTAGKMKNTFYIPGKSGLIWDGDLTPEGVSFSGTTEMFFYNLSNFVVQEVKSGPDYNLLAAQLGTHLELGSGELVVGAGTYQYSDTKGKAFSGASSKGNSITATLYDFNYKLIEGFVEFSMNIAGKKLNIYADYVQNSDPSKDNTGTQVGVSYGSTKDKGDWKIAVYNRKLEKDAVVDFLNDGDFAGGGTDNQGNVVSFGYQIADRSTFKVTHYMNEDVIDSPVTYKKTHLDFVFKF